MPTNKIAVLTGGGDCPGLNAVISTAGPKAMDLDQFAEAEFFFG